MNDHIPDAGKIPADGYYAAWVQCDTGGEILQAVRVCGGGVFKPNGTEIRLDACSDFGPIATWNYCHAWPQFAADELDRLRTANAALLEEVERYKQELDMSAANLLQTVNDRNRIGVQLDLIRDELMRIRARIGETGLIPDHPELSSIAGYCERAQADIAVLCTPIQERDRLDRELLKTRNENAALVEEVERLQAWKDSWVDIESKWDASAIAVMLGGKIGESTRTVIAREVPKLVERVREMKRIGDEMDRAEHCDCNNRVMCRKCYELALDWRKATEGLQ